MKINIAYLKRFVNLEATVGEWKALLTAIGIEVSQISGSGPQTVVEVEITPNRPDWLSHYGIAKEIIAKCPDLKFTPLRTPAVTLSRPPREFAVTIDDPGDCPRYSGCIVEDIRFQESPAEVQELLSSLDMRPINNLVDAANLAMLTNGQPLHVFDLDRLEGGQIIIRRARQGEKITLLDNRDLTLDPTHLVIADARRPIALAGIMGGLESGVQPTTRRIFIESACFNPALIRKSARLLGIHSDACYRFERGSDPQATVSSLQLVLKLIVDLSKYPGSVSTFCDIQPHPYQPVKVYLPKTYPAELSGIAIGPEISQSILEHLGFSLQDRGQAWEVRPPSWRVDIAEKQDLAEEVIRVHGYEKLPAVIPASAGTDFTFMPGRRLSQRIKECLIAGGIDEVVNYGFQAPEENRHSDPQGTDIVLKNPLGKDLSVMKNSLLGGLLRNIAHNLNQGQERVALFEINNVFALDANGQPSESETLAIGACGCRQTGNWREPRKEFDFFDFKSLLASLWRRLRISHTMEPFPRPAFREECAFAVRLGEARSPAGWIGEVRDEVSRFYQISRPVYFAEISLAAIGEWSRSRGFAMWNRYPASRRDFSFLIAKGVSYAELREAIDRSKPDVLEAYELVDVYSGPNIPADKVSLSLAFLYRGADRTLTNDEVNAAHQELVRKLSAQLHLIQR